MKRLYKGDQVSPLLNPIDAIGWKAMGWSETPPVAETEPTVEPDSGNPVVSREARESQLMDMKWFEIKPIAEGHGIEKPEGGWDEAVPLILEAEYGG